MIGSYVPSREESMQRFAALMQRVLSDAGYEVRMLQATPVLGRFGSGERGWSKWLGYLDRFVLFPVTLRRAADWADLIHVCDHGNAIYVPILKRNPLIVTCHDVLAIRSALHEVQQNPTRWTGRVLQSWILRGLRQARGVVCVSERTRTELLRLGGFSPVRVSVVANAMHHQFKPMSEADAWPRMERMGCTKARPFLLHVGSNIWYKNRDGVLRIFRALRALPGGEKYHLLMVGKPWTKTMRDFVSRMGLQSVVREVTDVSDEDLRALYSNAEALIFPSLDEGFGWPIIEAQACGCAAITSNRLPMTDVGGDAAIYIDPDDEVAAARTVLDHLPTTAHRRQRGFDNVKRFCDSTMLDGYLCAYRKVLGEPERNGLTRH